MPLCRRRSRRIRLPDPGGGATHAYFGHDQWATIAPGLKNIEDATELRRRILLAYESAEYEGSEEARRAALTFAIVGGGPTGVEMAGAIKEIAGQTLPEDYKHIDTRTTRVIIFQGDERLIPSFPKELSTRAEHDLEQMGVEVRLKSVVTNVTRPGTERRRANSSRCGTSSGRPASRPARWESPWASPPIAPGGSSSDLT